MVYTNRCKIEKGARKSVFLTLEEFKEKLYQAIIDKGCFELEELKSAKDIALYISEIIDFEKDCDIDFEKDNFESNYDNFDYYEESGNPMDILGFHEYKGFCWFGFCVGGDWEDSVFLILYYDGKKFRVYFPECGNIFNMEYREAIGNSENDVCDAFADISLLKNDFLSTIAIEGVSVIDFDKNISKPDEIFISNKNDIEEFLMNIKNLCENDILLEKLILDFANKNNLKIY